MNDVINRKDAIGAILSIGHIAELSDGDAVIRVSAVNYVLRNLPPTQSEIIHCKDCVHFEEHKNYGNLGESAYTCAGNMDGWIYPDSYCSNGRRKDG